MASAQSQQTAVLVVDDEALVRMYAVDMLEEAGFAVIEAANAELALDQLALHPEVTVLFSDINMPGAFDGVELARRVASTHPRLRVILTSGRGQPAPGEFPGDFVAKPYRGTAVAELIRAGASR